MAQRITGIDARRRRATTKQQKEAENKVKIEKLTFQIGELRDKLTEVTEAREAMVLPNLEGRTVEHAQYGQGTVSDQTDAVLTIEYARGTRDDKEATESCRKIQDLDNEQARLRKEIQYCESWISDLQKKS